MKEIIKSLHPDCENNEKDIEEIFKALKDKIFLGKSPLNVCFKETATATIGEEICRESTCGRCMFNPKDVYSAIRLSLSPTSTNVGFIFYFIRNAIVEVAKSRINASEKKKKFIEENGDIHYNNEEESAIGDLYHALLVSPLEKKKEYIEKLIEYARKEQ